MVNVEVVYAPADKTPVHIQLNVAPGTTVGEVLHQSKLKQQYPETETMPVGIFAKKVSLDTPVKAGDRIELYRPLLIDPKEKRRERALKKKNSE